MVLILGSTLFAVIEADITAGTVVHGLQPVAAVDIGIAPGCR